MVAFAVARSNCVCKESGSGWEHGWITSTIVVDNAHELVFENGPISNCVLDHWTDHGGEARSWHRGPLGGVCPA